MLHTVFAISKTQYAGENIMVSISLAI